MLFLPTTPHGFEVAKWVMAWWNVRDILEDNSGIYVKFLPADGTDVHAW